MACALARSFKLWNGSNNIAFHLATDAPRDNLPRDLRDLSMIHVSREDLGSGFSSKLQLDRLAPAELSLFVDSDCLCFGSLEPAFQVFRGHAVSVIGREISQGEWG